MILPPLEFVAARRAIAGLQIDRERARRAGIGQRNLDRMIALVGQQQLVTAGRDECLGGHAFLSGAGQLCFYQRVA